MSEDYFPTVTVEGSKDDKTVIVRYDFSTVDLADAFRRELELVHGKTIYN